MNEWNFKTSLGFVKLRDIEKFKEWYHSEGFKWDKDKWKDLFYKEQKVVGGDLHSLLNSQFSEVCLPYVWREEERDTEGYKQKKTELINKQIDRLLKFIIRLGSLNQPVNLFYKHDEYCLIGSSRIQFAIPTQFLEITLLKDYSSLPVSSLRQLAQPSQDDFGLQNNQLATKSINDVKSEAEQKSQQFERLKQEIEDVKKDKNDELAKLKAEIEAKQNELERKKQALMLELEQKKEELETQMMTLEVDLFKLESEIYSIRCFLGEVVNFAKIREGKPCNKEDQIVLFQKVRYLDEEMGKLVSLYNFDGEDLEQFEEVLKQRDEIFEAFCPSNRCISLVRVSRTEKQFFPDDKCANLLKDYETYHGNQIGILVRDNENLYVGWTDQDKVIVKEDFFYTPKVTVVDASKEPDPYKREKTRKEVFNETMSTAKEFVSRKFIFSVLQGICENENAFLQIADKYKPVTYTSKAFVFSAADNWLVDRRYGSFQDIVDKCNSQISLRDRVLTVQNLRPQTHGQYGYISNNDRGRGYADRTHDCSVSDCEIYPINFVESKGIRIRCQYQDSTGSFTWTTSKEKGEPWHFAEGVKILWEEEYEDFDYYVSVEKQWSDSGARSNFQVFEDEFINLQYMNSEWLLYAINTRNLGGWEVGGKEVNYTYAIRYLRKALEYVQEREIEEKELISKYLDLSGINDWMVKLSEWKLSHKVRWITDFQAKRFAKSIKSKKESQV